MEDFCFHQISPEFPVILKPPFGQAEASNGGFLFQSKKWQSLSHSQVLISTSWGEWWWIFVWIKQVPSFQSFLSHPLDKLRQVAEDFCSNQRSDKIWVILEPPFRQAEASDGRFLFQSKKWQSFSHLQALISTSWGEWQRIFVSIKQVPSIQFF